MSLLDWIFPTKPFEFGPVESRDRILANAILAGAGQGNLLTDSSAARPILRLGQQEITGSKVSRAAFSTIQSFFQSHAVTERLKPVRLLGFMTESLEVNGCAFALRPEDHVHSISVTFGSFLDSLFTAYRLLSERGIWSNLPFGGVKEGVILATGKSLPLPADKPRRELAARLAQRALLATFLHEMAHILRGHTHYLSLMHGLDVFDEKNSSGLTAQGVSERILLEIDADDFTGRFLADVFLRPWPTPELLMADPVGKNLVQEIMTSVAMTFCQFDASPGRYPVGFLRAEWVLFGMFSHKGFLPKQLAALVLSHVEQIRQALVDLGLCTRPDEQGDLAARMEFFKHLEPARETRIRDWLSYRPWPTPELTGASVT
jgi:hypothetical protein